MFRKADRFQRTGLCTAVVLVSGLASLGPASAQSNEWVYRPEDLDGRTGWACTFSFPSRAQPSFHADTVCYEEEVGDGLFRQSVRRLHNVNNTNLCPDSPTGDAEALRACKRGPDGNPVAGFLTPCGLTGGNGCAVCEPAFSTCHSSSLAELVGRLQSLADASPGTPLADALAEVIADAEAALARLAQSLPDRKGAIDDMKWAIVAVESAVEDRVLVPGRGATFMDDIAGFARFVAAGAIQEAMARGGEAKDIHKAQLKMNEGDLFRTAALYEDAADRYKDAAGEAEGS